MSEEVLCITITKYIAHYMCKILLVCGCLTPCSNITCQKAKVRHVLTTKAKPLGTDFRKRSLTSTAHYDPQFVKHVLRSTISV